MIILITGEVGAGKTYYALNEIATRYKGCPICSNMFFRWRKAKGYEHSLVFIGRDPLKCLKFRVNKGLIVFDEVGAVKNSRSWKHNFTQKDLELITQSRKQGWDILFITQAKRMADPVIREMAFTEVQIENLDRFKLFWIIPIFKWLPFKFRKARWLSNNFKMSNEFFLIPFMPSVRYDTRGFVEVEREIDLSNVERRLKALHLIVKP